MNGWSCVSVCVLITVSLCGFCVSVGLCVCLWMKGWSICVFVVVFPFDVDLCIALFHFIQRCWCVLCVVICCVRYSVFYFQEWAFYQFFQFIEVCMCVCTHCFVLCFPWGSVSMFVAWDAYDHFYGCLRSSECFDLFVCLREVYVMRYVDWCQHSSAF